MKHTLKALLLAAVGAAVYFTYALLTVDEATWDQPGTPIAILFATGIFLGYILGLVWLVIGQYMNQRWWVTIIFAAILFKLTGLVGGIGLLIAWGLGAGLLGFKWPLVFEEPDTDTQPSPHETK